MESQKRESVFKVGDRVTHVYRSDEGVVVAVKDSSPTVQWPHSSQTHTRTYLRHVSGSPVEQPLEPTQESGGLTNDAINIVTDRETGGKKQKKLEEYALIPVGPLAEVARVYGKGAEKYEDRNWEKGYAWSLSYSALQRHANKFWGGQSRDEETGCHHLASVVFHALAMMEFENTHPEKDDRSKNA